MNFIAEMQILKRKVSMLESKIKRIIDLCFDVKNHKLVHKPKNEFERGLDEGAEKVADEILRYLNEYANNGS